MRTSPPPARSLNVAIKRHLTSFVSAAAILVASTVIQAQEPDEGGENLLVLSRTLCGEKYYDTPRMSKCLQRQSEKADRWLSAIIASYSRYCAEAMVDMSHGGNVPFDQVAQLRKTQAAFEGYREEAATLAGRTGLYGSIAGLESAKAYFELTVDRARFLLDTCNHPLNSKLTDQVDLTIVDWCPPG
jgi:uncharacterized protein YecT (DUF1311 family)